MNQFIHLKTHSEFSLSIGCANIKKILQKTLKLNMPAIALTDCNNIFGIIKFYKLARSYGIKPIIGVDFKFHDNIHYKNEFNLTALIINEEGFYNIKSILTLGYTYRYKNFYLDNHLLLKFKEGLIILSGGINSDITKLLLYDDKVLLEKKINFWKENFPNRYYLEITRTNKQNEELYIKKARKLSIKYNIPLVATNNILFVEKKDFYVHTITTSITSHVSNNPKKVIVTKQQYLKSTEQMLKLFQDIPEALINSVQIAKRCNLQIEINKKYYLPNCIFKSGVNNYKLLINKAKIGLKKRLHIKHEKNFNINQLDFIIEYHKRLLMELNIINQLGFCSYFLIVAELMQWAKKRNIPIGPGRGSGAGSLVAYVLEITEIDPLKYDLLFERFLNPEKKSMPDFDIDFCMERRDEIIAHIIKLYGINTVSQIITFGTLGAKGSIRNTGRILGYPYSFVDNIVKLMPKDPKLNLHYVLENNAIIKEQYNNDEYIKKLIDTSLKVEGSIKNVGKHAGGVIITPINITNFTSIYKNADSKIPITQFDKNDLEEIGLVKFDFLGLTTLTMLNYCIYLINQTRKNNKFYIEKINLNDQKCFKALLNLKTNTLFQLESVGMKSLINQIKPKSFEDLAAILALYRPGPIGAGLLEKFIERKQGKEKIYYPDANFEHINLKPVLESTYGVIIYQEQIMQITQIIAGYTLGESDLLRRLMAKKDTATIKKQGANFIKKACALGYNIDFCKKLYELIENFSGYGFNKSHANCYALLTYQTLWLQIYHTEEFMAANFSVNMHNAEQLKSLLFECEYLNIKIINPNINISEIKFILNKDREIIYGLDGIKGLEQNIMKRIIQERRLNGQYKTLYDFFKRILSYHSYSFHMVKILIFTGCFDIYCKNRARLFVACNIYWKYFSKLYYPKNKKNPVAKPKKNDRKKLTKSILKKKLFFSKILLIDKEYKYYGFYFTKHPLILYKNEIQLYNNKFYLNLLDKLEFKSCKIVGMIINFQEKISSKGYSYFIYTIEDQFERINLFINQTIYTRYKMLLITNNILIFKITKKNNIKTNYKYIFIVKEVMSLIQAREKTAKHVNIKIMIKEFNNKKKMKKLHEIINKYKNGKVKLIKEIVYNNQSKFINDNNKITPEIEFFHEISMLFKSDTRISLVF